MRAALVGTGAIARQHLACLSQLPGVELVGVCDLSPVSAEWAAERFGASAWFTDHREMLERARPDVVHITTPVPSHHPLAMDALDAGAHVLVEKPITVDAQQLHSLLARASATGRSVIEGYNYVFNPPVLELLELIEQGRLGQVVHAEALLRLDVLGAGRGFVDPDLPHPALALPGGAIGDFVSHLAALVHRVVGEHRTVSTLWTDEGRGDGLAAGLQVMIEAERGTAAIRFSDRSRPQRFALHVNGDETSATAVISGHRLVLERQAQWRRPLATGRHAVADTFEAARAALRSPWQRIGGMPGLYEGMWTLIERSYAALESGRPLPVTHDEIAAVNRLRFDILAGGRPA